MILGIGDDGLAGLTESARQLLGSSDLLLAAPTILTLLSPLPAPKQPLQPEMNLALQQVKEALASTRRPILVCGGDPLFYGVARYLCDRLGKDLFDVVPHVSSMQLAFARIKESWEDAYLTNLAGRPIEAVADRIRTAEKVGLFPSDDFPPSRLATELLDRGIDYFKAYVCENLGSPDERVTQAELEQLATMTFDPLTVLILIRKPDSPDRARASGRHRLFGNPDDAFAQSLPKRGLITQCEVRAIALAQLDIRPSSIVWDIGPAPAPSPSKPPSSPRSAPFTPSSPNPPTSPSSRPMPRPSVSPTSARSPAPPPAHSRHSPSPDAIFVGGTGRELELVLNIAYARLRDGGTMAVNVATIEGLAATYHALKAMKGELRVWNFAISRGIDQMDRLRFEAISPTFLLAITKHLHDSPSFTSFSPGADFSHG